MADETIDYVLYDSVALGTTTGADITFFNATEAGSGKYVTNMQIAGQLPSTQRFVVDELNWTINPEVATNDIKDICDRASIELQINSRRVYIAPLQMHIAPDSFLPQGATETVSHGVNYVQRLFKKPLLIPGGTPFKVIITVGQTAAASSLVATARLIGQLTRPA